MKLPTPVSAVVAGTMLVLVACSPAESVPPREPTASQALSTASVAIATVSPSAPAVVATPSPVSASSAPVQTPAASVPVLTQPVVVDPPRPASTLAPTPTTSTKAGTIPNPAVLQYLGYYTCDYTADLSVRCSCKAQTSMSYSAADKVRNVRRPTLFCMQLGSATALPFALHGGEYIEIQLDEQAIWHGVFGTNPVIVDGLGVILPGPGDHQLHWRFLSDRLGYSDWSTRAFTMAP